jgi:hypothetical protein
MPGPISDSYDPEWGSQGPQAGEIDDVLEAAYDRGRASWVAGRPSISVSWSGARTWTAPFRRR